MVIKSLLDTVLVVLYHISFYRTLNISIQDSVFVSCIAYLLPLYFSPLQNHTHVHLLLCMIKVPVRVDSELFYSPLTGGGVSESRTSKICRGLLSFNSPVPETEIDIAHRPFKH